MAPWTLSFSALQSLASHPRAPSVGVFVADDGARYQVFAVLVREGGALLALPEGATSTDLRALTSDIFGPSRVFPGVPLASTRGVAVQKCVNVLVVDVQEDEGLAMFHALEEDEEEAVFFDARGRLPMARDLLAVVREWLAAGGGASREAYAPHVDMYLTATDHDEDPGSVLREALAEPRRTSVLRAAPRRPLPVAPAAASAPASAAGAGVLTI